jgi:hypothetical protein
MKKLLTLAIILLLTGKTYSQDVKFGVYFAPQIAWLSPESKSVSSDGAVVGFAGGLNIDKYFDKNYAFAMGVATSGQGGVLIYDQTSSSTLKVYDSTYSLAGKTVKYNLQYINIPLGLKLRSNEIGYLRFHVLVGFTNQFNIKAKATEIGGAGDFDDDSIKDEVNIYNLGYHFGGGVDYALGEDTSLFLTLVYDNGFIDVFKSEPRVLSRMISIRAGVTF